jgi:hypothetical protein
MQLGFYTEIGIGDGIESRVGSITHVNALKVGRQLAINWQVGYIDLLVNGSVVTLEVRIKKPTKRGFCARTFRSPPGSSSQTTRG